MRAELRNTHIGKGATVDARYDQRAGLQLQQYLFRREFDRREGFSMNGKDPETSTDIFQLPKHCRSRHCLQTPELSLPAFISGGYLGGRRFQLSERSMPMFWKSISCFVSRNNRSVSETKYPARAPMRTFFPRRFEYSPELQGLSLTIKEDPTNSVPELDVGLETS